MDLTIKTRNPTNGRFEFTLGVDGDVSFDDTEAHAVITSCLEDLGAYWADPTHGSQLGALRSLTRRTPSQAEATVLQALDPLVRTKAIAQPTADATSNLTGGSLEVDVLWTTPSGQPQKATV